MSQTRKGKKKKINSQSQHWQQLSAEYRLCSPPPHLVSFLDLSFLLKKKRKEKKKRKKTPLQAAAQWYDPGHLTGPKNSLCCCECQSKRSARQGLPWVTLHRLVRACEMDNSLGGLSGPMTRFPGIRAAVLWPGSPSKELYYGALVPLRCSRYRCHGRTGG